MAKKRRKPVDVDINKEAIMDACDAHLDFLAHGNMDVDYPELIKMAGEKIKQLQAAIDIVKTGTPIC